MVISERSGFFSKITVTLHIRSGELQSVHFPVNAQGVFKFNRFPLSGPAIFLILAKASSKVSTNLLAPATGFLLNCLHI